MPDALTITALKAADAMGQDLIEAGVRTPEPGSQRYFHRCTDPPENVIVGYVKEV